MGRPVQVWRMQCKLPERVRGHASAGLGLLIMTRVRHVVTYHQRTAMWAFWSHPDPLQVCVGGVLEAGAGIAHAMRAARASAGNR